MRALPGPEQAQHAATLAHPRPGHCEDVGGTRPDRALFHEHQRVHTATVRGRRQQQQLDIDSALVSEQRDDPGHRGTTSVGRRVRLGLSGLAETLAYRRQLGASRLRHELQQR